MLYHTYSISTSADRVSLLRFLPTLPHDPTLMPRGRANTRFLFFKRRTEVQKCAFGLCEKVFGMGCPRIFPVGSGVVCSARGLCLGWVRGSYLCLVHFAGGGERGDWKSKKKKKKKKNGDLIFFWGGSI